MGHFVYGMNVSVDLRIEQVPGDNGAGEWLHIHEELHRIIGGDVPIDLDLLEHRSFQQGVTMHHYAVRDAKQASPC